MCLLRLRQCDTSTAVGTALHPRYVLILMDQTIFALCHWRCWEQRLCVCVCVCVCVGVCVCVCVCV
jgi:hypothetical protein